MDSDLKQNVVKRGSASREVRMRASGKMAKSVCSLKLKLTNELILVSGNRKVPSAVSSSNICIKLPPMKNRPIEYFVLTTQHHVTVPQLDFEPIIERRCVAFVCSSSAIRSSYLVVVQSRESVT